MDFIQLIVCFAVLLHPTLSSPPVILHLKTTQQISSSSPHRSWNKLMSFQHNISLTVSLSVGSPPQQVTMVLDTGSELSWLHCSSTKSPVSFSPGLSRSYRAIPCSSPTCTTRTRDLTLPVSCDPNHLCHAILSYADSSSVEGTLSSDAFLLAAAAAPFPGTVFGCMDSGSTSTPDEDSKTTGLIGMNRGSLSLVSQMGFRKFSYCISGRDSSGVLLLGDDYELPSWLRPLNYTPFVRISTPLPYFDRVAYTVELQGIRVAGRALPLPGSVLAPDHTGAGQTMVDSGTQFTFLMGPAYAALRKEFLRRTEGVLRPLEFVFEGAMDLCYRVEAGRRLPAALPSVSLVFRGAEMRVTTGEKLLYRVPGVRREGDDVYCLTFGNSDLLGVEAYVIGHHHQQDVWMEFDLAGERVGLADFSCDVARHNLGLPP